MVKGAVNIIYVPNGVFLATDPRFEKKLSSKIACTLPPEACPFLFLILCRGFLASFVVLISSKVNPFLKIP